MSNLGNWALIDIETTGIDASYDAIIDLGFLQFEGTKLVRKYSSLVRTDIVLSQFIQKLTGITQKQIQKAPTWASVEPELLDLASHRLLAHNAAFEEKFLKKYFDDLEGDIQRETYEDSLLYLAMLFPEKSKLNLEGFLIDLKLADKEEHRGLSDSIDLLKVLLLSTYLTHFDSEFRHFLMGEFARFSVEEFWYKKFFMLTQNELLEIAVQIDLDLNLAMENYKASLREQTDEAHETVFDGRLSFDGGTLKKVFEAESAIQKILPKYSFRKTQEDLALKVGQSFKNELHAMIQAPTGTGKTMGYLIPAFLFAKNTNQQVLVSTGTKTLQTQAMNKDIPQVHRILGMGPEEVKVERLIGSGNHFCELLFRNKEQKEGMMELGSFESRFSKAYFETVFFHNQRCEKENIITRDATPYVFKRSVEGFSDLQDEIGVDYRSCTGHKCPFKNSCTYMKGLRRAKEAQVIIGNHALTFTWPRSLARPEFVIMDEAHKLENEVTKAFSRSIEQKELENLTGGLSQNIGPLFYLLGNDEPPRESEVTKIRKETSDVVSMLRDHLVPLKDHMEKYFQASSRYTELYWNELPMIKKEGLNNSVASAIYNHCESLKHILESYYTTLVPYISRYSVDNLNNDENKIVAYTAFESLMGHLEDIVLALSTLIGAGDNYAQVLRYHAEFGYAFDSSPIDTGKVLHEELLSLSRSVVFTSATLANSGGTLGTAGSEWMTGYSYLDPKKRFQRGLYLEDVYDYKNRAKVIVATNVPNIYKPEYVDDVLEELIPLIRDLNGSTLLLYSAKTRFERAVEILFSRLEGEIPVFVQGMGNNVIEDFKQSACGVLVGMESFGEGIDIPGKSLQMVYVDKVPDLRMEFVIQKRRDFYEKQFGNEFTDYYLAHRTRSLHQKLGRLIRTESDKGGVIITDPRIGGWKGPTLNTFTKLMEPYQLQFSNLRDACIEVKNFIQL